MGGTPVFGVVLVLLAEVVLGWTASDASGIPKGVRGLRRRAWRARPETRGVGRVGACAVWFPGRPLGFLDGAGGCFFQCLPKAAQWRVWKPHGGYGPRAEWNAGDMDAVWWSAVVLW
jgi:hypothetical protein